MRSVRSISASATVVDIAYAIQSTINCAVIVTKTPGVYLVFGIIGAHQMHESVAHAVEVVTVC